MRKAGLCICVGLWCFAAPGNAQVVTNLSERALSQKPTLAPQSMVLIRTVAAPYGAEGSVELQSSNSPAGRQLVMVLEIQALTPGKYRVEYAEVPNGPWLELALITTRDPETTPDVEANARSHEDGTTHQSEGIKSRIGITLPAEAAPNKIHRIRLMDMGGTVLLEGKAR